MPLSRALARANRVGLNRVTRHLAPHLPGFGLVEHRGRRSGRVYRTPVNVFAKDGGFVIALTYGAESQWVRNVMAARKAVVVTAGARHPVMSPRIVRDPTRHYMPALVRLVLARIDVDDFLLVDAAPAL
jgi:deazaflavin-dependent oxidoreductase (nitroreductase family)